VRVARLRRVHAKLFRTGRDSGWPQRLGDVVTGRASRKEPVGESEERVEAFAGARTAALPVPVHGVDCGGVAIFDDGWSERSLLVRYAAQE
jgi:hypothetical protein